MSPGVRSSVPPWIDKPEEEVKKGEEKLCREDQSRARLKKSQQGFTSERALQADEALWAEEQICEAEQCIREVGVGDVAGDRRSRCKVVLQEKAEL